MKLAVIVGFVTEMLQYIKLVKDGDFGNSVEGAGVSFLTSISVVVSGINPYLSYFSVLWLNTL